MIENPKIGKDWRRKSLACIFVTSSHCKSFAAEKKNVFFVDSIDLIILMV